jgi:NADH-quinone oxidoreductase subunit I
VTRHGSIRLIESNCTSCMICARECPTWCITIDSHSETVADLPAGARPRTEHVLDSFAIDWSLCMYCGICIEECPFDALEWADPVTPAGLFLVDEMVAQPPDTLSDSFLRTKPRRMPN